MFAVDGVAVMSASVNLQHKIHEYIIYRHYKEDMGKNRNKGSCCQMEDIVEGDKVNCIAIPCLTNNESLFSTMKIRYDQEKRGRD